MKRGWAAKVASAPLPQRLAGVLLGRLVVLVSVVLVAASAFPMLVVGPNTASGQVLWLTVAGALTLSAAYAVWLRSGRHLEQLANLQLVFDQVIWTAFVYLTGGASSGATALYGVSCLVGAALTGLRGAIIATVSGLGLYLLLGAALAYGWLSPPPDQPPQLWTVSSADLGYHAFVTLLVLVVVSALGAYLAERLRVQSGELVQAEARAVHAERLAVLGRVAAGLAHEIRNPLGAIAASVKLLESSTELTADERLLCELIRRETSRLDDLVSDMMDLARARKPERTQVDVARVAREVVTMAQHVGRAAGDVEVGYVGLETATVSADPAQLRQLLWNLLRNAVQASRPGARVEVRVEAGPGGLELSVSDEGEGLDAEAREQLFDAFYSTRTQGTGLGLAVVKRIADEHGFELSVESEQGRGARFTVSLGACSVTAP